MTWLTLFCTKTEVGFAAFGVYGRTEKQQRIKKNQVEFEHVNTNEALPEWTKLESEKGLTTAAGS